MPDLLAWKRNRIVAWKHSRVGASKCGLNFRRDSPRNCVEELELTSEFLDEDTTVPVGYATAWWVRGRPSSFATASEGAWKASIATTVPECAATHRESALRLDFVLKGPQEGPAAMDLDNLLEPTLSQLVNKLRWFKGSRPNVTAIAATKQYDLPTGCLIALAREVGQPWDPTAARGPVVRFAYPGPLPTSARDPVLSDWLIENGAQLISPGPRRASAQVRRTAKPR